MLKRIAWLLRAAHRRRRARLAGCCTSASTSRIAGYATPDQFIEIPQGAGQPHDRRSARRGRRDSRFHHDHRIALYMSGQGRRLQAGEYRFDRPMTPFDVIDKIARGDVFVITVTFREGLSIAEMSKIFEVVTAWARPPSSSLRRRAIPNPIRELDAGGEGSRGLSLSGHLSAAAKDGRRAARAADGRSGLRTRSLPNFDRRPPTDR